MTREEIIELFIRAAETDRRLPDTARPARLKAQSLPYHHDKADMNGWGSERLEEERAAFWEERSTRLKTSDVSDWERANSLIVLVYDESERRCLWHWAIGKAGGRPFKRWCRDEGIHVETGRRRKDRAISQITLAFIRKPLHNNENGRSGMLPVGPGNRAYFGQHRRTVAHTDMARRRRLQPDRSPRASGLLMGGEAERDAPTEGSAETRGGIVTQRRVLARLTSAPSPANRARGTSIAGRQVAATAMPQDGSLIARRGTGQHTGLRRGVGKPQPRIFAERQTRSGRACGKNHSTVTHWRGSASAG